jgi:L-fuconolactonase
MIPVVDTHQHLWHLEQFRLPWLSGEGAGPLNRSFLMSDYLEAAAESAVARTVYMEVDVDPADREAEADFIIDMCRRTDNPMAAAVIAGDPGEAGFSEYAERFKDSRFIKGFRRVLQVPEVAAGYCLEPSFLGSVRMLGEIGKSFDLCIRPSELGDGLKVVEQCPDTLLIVDHCGNADPLIVNGTIPPDPGNPFGHTKEQWQRDMAALGARENAVCKISGIVARAPEGWEAETLAPTVEHCLDAFGPDRVVFGGDWPVCTLGAPFGGWVKALREIVSSRPEEEQAKLFHANADRLYNLA